MGGVANRGLATVHPEFTTAALPEVGAIAISVTTGGQTIGNAQPVKLKGCLSWSRPSWCLVGRSALPLEPGDGGHRGRPPGHQGQATEPTKSAKDQLAGHRLAQVPGWLVALAARAHPDRGAVPAAGGRSHLPALEAGLERQHHGLADAPVVDWSRAGCSPVLGAAIPLADGPGCPDRTRPAAARRGRRPGA
jgi:hypothetical protein